MLLLAPVVLAALLARPADARDEPRPVVAAIGDRIESCVDTSALRFASGERRVLLDAKDTTALGEAFVRRYPAFAQTSSPPQHVVMWEKPGNGWVYVALLVNPGKPGEVCFTASFAAERFGMSGALKKKYFGLEL